MQQYEDFFKGFDAMAQARAIVAAGLLEIRTSEFVPADHVFVTRLEPLLWIEMPGQARPPTRYTAISQTRHPDDVYLFALARFLAADDENARANELRAAVRDWMPELDTTRHLAPPIGRRNTGTP